MKRFLTIAPATLALTGVGTPRMTQARPSHGWEVGQGRTATRNSVVRPNRTSRQDVCGADPRRLDSLTTPGHRATAG